MRDRAERSSRLGQTRANSKLETLESLPLGCCANRVLSIERPGPTRRVFVQIFRWRDVLVRSRSPLSVRMAGSYEIEQRGAVLLLGPSGLTILRDALSEFGRVLKSHTIPPSTTKIDQ